MGAYIVARIICILEKRLYNYLAAMSKTKEYSNGEVTVVWKPDLCIHTGICVKGLPEVFKPDEKPWVKAKAAATSAIVKQVKECPSGALSHYINDQKKANEPEEIIRIEVRHKGPLVVHGNVMITHDDGREETKERIATFCRCGASASKPFCDGSHKEVDFKS